MSQMGEVRASMHKLRGSMNGVVLQLEVLALAVQRGDEALLTRSLEAARAAAADAVKHLDGMRALEGR